MYLYESSVYNLDKFLSLNIKIKINIAIWEPLEFKLEYRRAILRLNCNP